jgi:murein DD-endopeptidase MepM/ murein hydrolase activator NlpD
VSTFEVLVIVRTHARARGAHVLQISKTDNLFEISRTRSLPGTFHAVDFECPVGTPVLAVGDGVVVDVQQHNTVTGCHVSNLFKWNSVMLRLDDGVYVEYVHVQRGSCRLAPGDRVRAGDKVCETGDVGFCPSPHLHMQMHESADHEAPTIKFALHGPGGQPYFPEAGSWYEQCC